MSEKAKKQQKTKEEEEDKKKKKKEEGGEEKKEGEENKEKENEVEAAPTPAAVLQGALDTLKSGRGRDDVQSRVRRALRKVPGLRRSFADDCSALRHAVLKELGEDKGSPLLLVLPEAMDTGEGEEEEEEKPQQQQEDAGEYRDVELYLHLLVVLYLLDTEKLTQAAECSLALINKVSSFDVAAESLLACKAYFYYARTAELSNHLSDVRNVLLAAFRTANIKHDAEAAFTLLNLLLRNYLHYSLYDQAAKLASQSQSVIKSMEEGRVSNNQVTRYLYYKGRIEATQLNYAEAVDYLSEALRKAPQTTALGFRLLTTKLLTIVQLLVGEIPERSVFSTADMEAQLKPYFRLAKSVRIGDLKGYNDTVRASAEQFRQDRTYPLIVRLRHNVIKTGLRKINVAYSRISFQDVMEKLNLDSAEEAEYIVAKAIKDHVMEAEIDHAGGFVRSAVTENIYSTYVPHEQFSKRIGFCLKMHNKAVKAMRFPDEIETKVVLKTKEEEEAAEAERSKKKK